MNIRRAKKSDKDSINNLLRQVLEVHYEGRPDIFKKGAKKYTDDELLTIIDNDDTPVFVAEDDSKNVLGYAFCVFVCHKNNNILTDIKTLYIDDLCVDESARGKHVGKALYDYVLDFAKQTNCYNVTLNVWAKNKGAVKFYEKCGLKPQKIGLEKIL